MLKRLLIPVFILLGAAVLGLGLHATYYALASRAWPRAEGMVLESGIEAGSRRTRTYRAEVRYRYRVDGRSYEGTRLYFAGLPMATDSDGARGMLAGLAPGRTVAVAYDPARPERAVLRPGIGPPTRLSVAAGAAFLGFGLLCLVLERRAERRRGARP